jgi:hypothetical protein
MILRCTRKLRARLPEAAIPNAPGALAALGNWHATLLVARPAWLVLLVNDASRLPVILPARELSTLLERIPGGVAEVLTAIGIDVATVARERSALENISLAPTASRSVVGTMNDFVFQFGWIRDSTPNDSLLGWSLTLAQTPVGPLAYARPVDAARRLLAREIVP